MLKKFKVLIVIASLAITLSLMSNTYSRYVASSEGNFAIEFAKWQLLVNKTDITDSASYVLPLEPIIDSNNGNVAANKVAPSSTGYFDVEIDPTNVDVSFKYSIELSLDNNLKDSNGNPIEIDDLKITEYGILPEDYIAEDGLKTTPITSENGKSIISDTIIYGSDEFKTFTMRVFFKWVEGTDETMDDAADTEIGLAVAGINGANAETSQEQNIENDSTEAIQEQAEVVEGTEATINDATFKINANIRFEQYIG